MYQKIVTFSSFILGGAAAVCAVAIQNDPRIITRSNGDLQPSTDVAISRPAQILRDFAVRTSGEQIPESDTHVITGYPAAAR
jgi:hypothetical protein